MLAEVNSRLAVVAQPASDRVTRYASIVNDRVILLILVPWLAPSKRAFFPPPTRQILTLAHSRLSWNQCMLYEVSTSLLGFIDEEYGRPTLTDIVRFGSLSVYAATPDSDTTADGARLTEESPSERIDRLVEWARELWRKAYE